MKKSNQLKLTPSMPYTSKQLAKAAGVTVKTVHRWVREGLKIVSLNGENLLIEGRDVKEFLRRREMKSKCKVGRYEYFCLTCKTPQKGKRGSTHISGNVKHAKCSVCNGNVSKIFKRL